MLKFHHEKTLTLKEIQSIHHDSLAKILLSMANSDDVVYKKMEKLLLSQNPKELYRSIISTFEPKFYLNNS